MMPSYSTTTVTSQCCHLLSTCKWTCQQHDQAITCCIGLHCCYEATQHTQHLHKESQFTEYVRSINSCPKLMNCYHLTSRRDYALCSPTLAPLDHILCPVKNDFNLHLPGLTVPPGQSPHSAHALYSGLCTDACQASQSWLEDKMPRETTMSLYLYFFG
jgi:hypothetical protein